MLCWFQVYSKVIQLHIYIYLFFFRFFPIISYYKILEFPVLYSRSLLFISFIHSRVYLLIPNS